MGGGGGSTFNKVLYGEAPRRFGLEMGVFCLLVWVSIFAILI